MGTRSISVSDDIQEEWEDFVEENEAYPNVSHLVRVAVRQFIETGGELSGPGQGTSSEQVVESVEVDMGSLEERMSRLEGSLSRQTEMLSVIVERADLEVADPSLEAEILELIPTIPKQEWKRYTGARVSEIGGLNERAREGFREREDISAVPLLAKRLGVDEEAIKETVNRLVRDEDRIGVEPRGGVHFVFQRLGQ
ncbi:hypothetical protein ACFPYI_13690 [Halomarina salina]|uniref:CopG family transcriptional regulator n=1 Tax=Halomarina salina TaxID=1872699 RepID=A0ABD5RPX5_9EURY|nr:hypothetical protein [Halomarina salina]